MAICPWALGTEIETQYHDHEWGVPLLDDTKQFEFLTLESAQAGLSWLTILKRREGYRKVFSGFVPELVAAYTEVDVLRLLDDSSIIRHRKKIEAAITNAQRFVEIKEEFGSFTKFIWGYVDGRPVQNTWRNMADIPPQTPLSKQIAADLKKRGWKFLGPVTVYAHMQAAGLVNDHLITCPRYEFVRSMGEAM